MKHRRIICVILIFALIVPLMQSGFVSSIGVDSTQNNVISTGEQKIFSIATINENFAEGRVLVVLKNEASLSLSEFSRSSFPEVKTASVQNLTQASTRIVNEKLRNPSSTATFSVSSDTITFEDFDINTETFHQILCINLEESGKEAVLKAIKVLEQRDDILYAGPDYI